MRKPIYNNIRTVKKFLLKFEFQSLAWLTLNMDLDDLLGPETAPLDKKKKKSSSGKEKLQSEKVAKKDKDIKGTIIKETNFELSRDSHQIQYEDYDRNVSFGHSDGKIADVDCEIQDIAETVHSIDENVLLITRTTASSSELSYQSITSKHVKEVPVASETNIISINSRQDEEDDELEDIPFSAASVVNACEKRVVEILRSTPLMPTAQTLAEKLVDQLRDQLNSAMGREKVLSQHLNEYKNEMVALLSKQRVDADALANAELRLLKSNVYLSWTQHLTNLDISNSGVASLQNYLDESVEFFLQNAESSLSLFQSEEQVHFSFLFINIR